MSELLDRLKITIDLSKRLGVPDGLYSDAYDRLTALEEALADQVAATLEHADEVIALREQVAALEAENIELRLKLRAAFGDIT